MTALTRLAEAERSRPPITTVHRAHQQALHRAQKQQVSSTCGRWLPPTTRSTVSSAPVHKVADLLHVPRPAQIAARERAMRAARQESK